MTYLFQGLFKDIWGKFSRSFQGLFFVLSNIHSRKKWSTMDFSNKTYRDHLILSSPKIWGGGEIFLCVFNFFRWFAVLLFTTFQGLWEPCAQIYVVHDLRMVPADFGIKNSNQRKYEEFDFFLLPKGGGGNLSHNLISIALVLQAQTILLERGVWGSSPQKKFIRISRKSCNSRQFWMVH